MEIPYTVEERPDTGLYNAKLGIWLFLASEVMLFGGLFSAYVFLRTGVDSWPVGAEILNVPLATLNTMFLITSSVTMVMSWASLKLNDFSKFKLYAGITLLLACFFLVVKYFEYTAKFDHHLYSAGTIRWAIDGDIINTNKKILLLKEREFPNISFSPKS